MHPSTLITVDYATSQSPTVKMEFSDTLRVGDRIQLRFRVTRTTGGRLEALEVTGAHEVTEVVLGMPGQSNRVTVRPLEPSKPIWKAIKKTKPRPWAPTHTKVCSQ